MTAAEVIELKGRPVQLQGNALARRALEAAGWTIKFDGLPSRQGVVIVYPHTSNWDFLIGLATKWSLGFAVHFWGKDSLFKIPLFGRWMRWVGGVPVDRKSPKGLVEQMVERIRQARDADEFFWLAIAPEGTRGHAAHWRSGFYRVALQSKVPLGLAYFDFDEKVVGLDRFIQLSGNQEADMAVIAGHLAHRRGKKPHLAAPVRLPPEHKEAQA